MGLWQAFGKESYYFFEFGADLDFKQSKGTCIDQALSLQDNYMKIVIFYSDLSYEYMEQVPSYDLMVLLGDIGGQLGLFLGSSVLTYFEFLDCLALVIYAKFFETFERRPHT